ncbi:MAG: SGNH/GDSL hydrolase family protein [Balneolaceae bacterium]
MKHRLRFIFGALLAIPLLPIIFLQGKRIRKEVPKLPEAGNPEGELELGYNQKSKVLFLGESTVAGVGVKTHMEGFAGSASRELARLNQKNIKWKVVARSGYTVRMVRRKLLRRIDDFQPDLIILGLGGNDAFKLHSPWKWRMEISKLITALNTVYPDVPIAFTNMPPIKEFPAFTKTIKFVIGNMVEILGIELHSLLKKFKNVYYSDEVIRIDDWVHLLLDKQTPDDFFSDGVHPSKLTYQTWGKEFARYLHRSGVEF